MKAWVDSTLFIDKASSINPTWLIVLYAYNLFTLNCVSPNTLPINNDKRLLNNNMFFQEKLKE